eukprot:44049-Hanusia_phi.AAC.1
MQAKIEKHSSTAREHNILSQYHQLLLFMKSSQQRIELLEVTIDFLAKVPFPSPSCLPENCKTCKDGSVPENWWISGTNWWMKLRCDVRGKAKKGGREKEGAAEATCNLFSCRSLDQRDWKTSSRNARDTTLLLPLPLPLLQHVSSDRLLFLRSRAEEAARKEHAALLELQVNLLLPLPPCARAFAFPLYLRPPALPSSLDDSIIISCPHCVHLARKPHGLRRTRRHSLPGCAHSAAGETRSEEEGRDPELVESDGGVGE